MAQHTDLHNDLAVYVHWPWCLHKCPYCDFNSHTSPPQQEAYLDALLKEIALWERRLPEDQTIVSVYFGGGTPSLMDPRSVEHILKALERLGRPKMDFEVSLECNPTSTAKQNLSVFYAAGVNRVSVGVQGLDDAWLGFLGRQHTTAHALETLETAMQIFGRVNADVIYGLPSQPLEAWVAQLSRLASMGLTHISAYQLTVEPNTRFFSDVRRGLWTPLGDDAERAFFDATQETLTHAGYENYETSNFAQPGHTCAHNVHVWRYGSYIGIGAGAHGRPRLADGTRWATSTAKLPDAYLNRVRHETDAFVENAALSDIQQVQEAAFLGLRLTEGLSLDALKTQFGEVACAKALDLDFYTYAAAQGLTNPNPTRLQLTEAGRPLLNGVLRHLLRTP